MPSGDDCCGSDRSSTVDYNQQQVGVGDVGHVHLIIIIIIVIIVIAIQSTSNCCAVDGGLQCSHASLIDRDVQYLLDTVVNVTFAANAPLRA